MGRVGAAIKQNRSGFGLKPERSRRALWMGHGSAGTENDEFHDE
jgi:hypothetical protein